MSIEDPNELNRIDDQIRRNELEARAEQIGGFLSEDCPPDIAEQFLNSVEQFESADDIQHIDLVKRQGIEVPAPQTLDDAALTSKLWDIINALAKKNTWLSSTNHLSDRELYEYLYNDVLRQGTKDMSAFPGYNYHLDLVDSGSDEDTHLWMKHYANEETRERWMKDFPDFTMPPHEDPPFDRDRLLPQAPLPQPVEWEEEDDAEDEEGEEWKRGEKPF